MTLRLGIKPTSKQDHMNAILPKHNCAESMLGPAWLSSLAGLLQARTPAKIGKKRSTSGSIRNSREKVSSGQILQS